MITIGFGHMIDFVMVVLGELSFFGSQLSIQRPQVPIMGNDGTVLETVVADVANHIMLQGTLKSGAPLSVTFRRGPPFKGTPGFTWSIHGEKGEIRITAAALAPQANDTETNITVHISIRKNSKLSNGTSVSKTYQDRLEMWRLFMKHLPVERRRICWMEEPRSVRILATQC